MVKHRWLDTLNIQNISFRPITLIMLFVGLLFTNAMLTGCGHKGELILPQEKTTIDHATNEQ
ncbi:MAG: hypothetical protein K6L75_11545 [Cellvibrionaceae bacterium]